MEVLHQTRNDCALHHGLCLNRHTRHRHQHLPTLLKPHDGCSAHLVLYHLARRWHHGLQRRETVHWNAAAGKHLVDIALYVLVEHHLATKVTAQSGFGYIILGRTQTTSHQH